MEGPGGPQSPGSYPTGVLTKLLSSVCLTYERDLFFVFFMIKSDDLKKRREPHICALR